MTTLFLIEQSTDLFHWQPAMPPRHPLLAHEKVTLPITGPQRYFRVVIQPSPDATMIRLSGFRLGVPLDFRLGKFEVTLGEWNAVIEAGSAFDYDLAFLPHNANPDFPASHVSWFDAVKWCNLKSEVEGLQPVYRVQQNPFREGETIPTLDLSASGYRLPTNLEWDFAVLGGPHSQGFTFSGSNNIKDVAWYRENSLGGPDPDESGRGPRPVGWKAANEVGFHDMSGNVWEWCWESWPSNPSLRRIRGGSYGTAQVACQCRSEGGAPPNSKDSAIGFRIAQKAALAIQD